MYPLQHPATGGVTETVQKTVQFCTTRYGFCTTSKIIKTRIAIELCDYFQIDAFRNGTDRYNSVPLFVPRRCPYLLVFCSKRYRNRGGTGKIYPRIRAHLPTCPCPCVYTHTCICVRTYTRTHGRASAPTHIRLYFFIFLYQYNNNKG